MDRKSIGITEKRILVVDDDRDFSDSLNDLISAEGYTVDVAYGIDQGIKASSIFKPHIALVDINLGGESGLEFLKLIQEQQPETICIMLTAYANIDSTIKSLRLGAHDYLRKPIQVDELLNAFDKCFDKLGLINEKFNAEQALRESEKRFRSLVNNIPGSIYRCKLDQKLTMLYMSNVIEKICGYSSQEIVSNHSISYIDIIHPDDIATVHEKIQDALELKQPYILEYRLVHKDGGTKWVYDKGQGVFASNEELLYMDGAIFDITESHHLSEQLTYYASHDVLTGLVNRREFELRLQRVLETGRDDNSEHALCYIDLDQFKIINDTSGHVAGDELLRQLGRLMIEMVRKRDTLARLGGDEFGVLMEHCNLEQANRVATKLLRSIEDYRFVWENKMFSVGASIGLVPIDNDALDSIDVLKQADAACYAAKDAGRNRIHVFRKDDTQLAQRSGEMKWVTEIQSALDENRFILYCQKIGPISKIGETSGTHYEILLRMLGSGGEIILPGSFLPAAERYNLSTRIDKWVVEHTFIRLLKYPKTTENLNRYSINLSGISVNDASFLEYIVRLLDETGVSADNICFEITETAAIANISRATIFINTLKELGCQFALDDFGSGLSSFAYLKNLPVDYLKIDGVFIKGIDTDPIELEMVKAINKIGKVMGKKTIAEFVENESILNILKEIGIDYAQGYYVDMPHSLIENESTTVT